jgi:hypothetical protein
MALEVGSVARYRPGTCPVLAPKSGPIAHFLIFLNNINTLSQIELNTIRASFPDISRLAFHDKRVRTGDALMTWFWSPRLACHSQAAG